MITKKATHIPHRRHHRLHSRVQPPAQQAVVQHPDPVGHALLHDVDLDGGQRGEPELVGADAAVKVELWGVGGC